MDTIDVYATSKPTALPVLRDQVQVEAAKIMPGMFVIGLDRPWQGTPFLLQAFLIDDPEQIRILRELCRHIIIDPRRSSHESLRDLINLYILPEEDEEEEFESTVKIRFVDSNRRSVSAPSAPGFSLNKIRANVTASLREIWDPSQGSPLSALPASAPSTSGSGAAVSALPRFSQTQIIYDSPQSDKGSANRPSKAARRALERESRGAADQGEEASRIADLQERFEQLIAALHPDWSSFTPGFKFFGALFRRLRQGDGGRRLYRKRAIVRRPAARREPSIPKIIDLVVYRDRHSVQKEVPLARQAVTSVEETLGHLNADLVTESRVRVDGLPMAIESMVDSVKRNPDALIWVARVRAQDSMAYTHSIKVASYLLSFGRHLGFPADQLSQLAMVGLLMDVGKLFVDPAVMNKRENLTPEEFAAVKLHVAEGLEHLGKTMDLSKEVRDGIAQHHEWINGEGYPAGLAGEEISIFGRMAAIVDAYSAMTTSRPYAPALSSYEALQVIYSQTGTKFHEPLVEQFVRAIGLFPVGSLVLLSTEEVAVVTSHDKAQRLEPRVLVLTNAAKHALPRPYERDLTRRSKDDEGNVIRILRSLPAGVHGIDFRNFYIA